MATNGTGHGNLYCFTGNRAYIIASESLCFPNYKAGSLVLEQVSLKVPSMCKNTVKKKHSSKITPPFFLSTVVSFFDSLYSRLLFILIPLELTGREMPSF
jgi:hypothetical protein